MSIFRQLRWKLTLSYTLVTVGALLAITLILGGLLFTQIFIPEKTLPPEQIVDEFMDGIPYSMLCRMLSQSPADTQLLNLFLQNSKAVITNSSLFSVGAVQFSITTNGLISA